MTAHKSCSHSDYLDKLDKNNNTYHQSIGKKLILLCLKKLRLITKLLNLILVLE